VTDLIVFALLPASNPNLYGGVCPKRSAFFEKLISLNSQGKKIVYCVLDLHGVIVHYNLFTRGLGHPATLHREMALGPIRPTPSYLLTQMSSSYMVILWRVPYF
jgi:hypothetical protein